MTLRRGTAGDVAEMYRLDCLCFEEPFRFDRRSMRRFPLQTDSLVVIAEDAGEMRGFVIYELSHRKLFTSAYVTTLDVHPDHRRSGVATALMDEADRLADAVGVNHINLHVFAGNEAAIRFYEQRGYRRITVTPDFYGNGLDGLLYLKRISTLPPGEVSSGRT